MMLQICIDFETLRKLSLLKIIQSLITHAPIVIVTGLIIKKTKIGVTIPEQMVTVASVKTNVRKMQLVGELSVEVMSTIVAGGKQESAQQLGKNKPNILGIRLA